MPNPFSKVKTGDRQRIPADAYNRFLDTADAVERSRLTGGAVPAAGFDTTLVTVRNDSDIDLPRFGVCKLVDSVVSPTAQGWKDGVWMTAEPPDGGDAVFAVTLEPIPPGHIGKAIVDGVTCVQIDVTDESHTCASPNAGDVEMLGSDTSGVPILWKESGIGVKWAYVLLGGGESGTDTSVPVWLVTNVCPVFDDEGEGSPGRYVRSGDAAGGDLGGYYPNPTIPKIDGGTF